MSLKLGSRGSELARTQSLGIAEALATHGFDCELKVIRTAGDDSVAARFADIGPQGVFVREIEQALLGGEIDFAVHSFKDLPSDSPPELMIAAVPARVAASDVLLVRAAALDAAAPLMPLRRGAVIGTASVRRQAWLKHLRPDLETRALRGNVPTRLGRLQEGRYDAILLASAGLTRLTASTLGEKTRAALEGLHLHPLDPEIFVPAPAQGALAIQCRAEDHSVRGALALLDDPASARVVAVERELLGFVAGGCDVAFGAHCSRGTDGYRVSAMLERNGRVVAAAAGPEPETSGLASRAWTALLAALES